MSITSVASEVDVDLNVDLKAPRGFRVMPAVLNYSEPIAAAYQGVREAIGRHRSAVSAVRQSLTAVSQARRTHEAELAAAVLDNGKEPKEPDVSEHFAEVRRQMSQVRAMRHAIATGNTRLKQALREHGPAAIEAMRERARGFADEAVQHHDAMENALGNFGGLKYAAEWLDDWTFSDAHRSLNAREWTGVDAPEATITQARRAVEQ